MLEEWIISIYHLLPSWVVVPLIVIVVLWRVGTLERMASTLHLWLQSMLDADKARREFQQEVAARESEHDKTIDELHAQSHAQAASAYNLEQMRFRQQLMKIVLRYIKFLESELSKNNDFLRERMESHDFKRTNKKQSEKDTDI